MIRHRRSVGSRRHDRARPQAAGPRADLGLASLLLVGRSCRRRCSHAAGIIDSGFRDLAARRSTPTCCWAMALGAGQVLIRGEAGQRAALRAAGRALHRRDGDLPDALRPLHRLHRLEPVLASPAGSFNGLDNLVPDAGTTRSTGTRSRNMVFYVLAVLVEYAIAFGLALLLNAEIRGAQILPRRLPAAPSCCGRWRCRWMIGKSLMEYRFGPLGRARALPRLGQPGLLRSIRGSPASRIDAAWMPGP